MLVLNFTSQNLANVYLTSLLCKNSSESIRNTSQITLLGCLPNRFPEVWEEKKTLVKPGSQPKGIDLVYQATTSANQRCQALQLTHEL